MPIERIFESTFTLTMSGVPEIPLPPDLDRALLGDFFVTLPIGKVGAESLNDRKYPLAAYQSMIDTLNTDRPMGWWGHTDDSQRSTIPPAVKWLGAVMTDDGMIYGKLVPLSADVRRYYEVALATRGIVGNSLYGEGEYEEDGHTVKNLRVHHIDILAKGEWGGVPETAGLPVLTKEIKEKDTGKMPYSESEIQVMVGESARLKTLETSLIGHFGGTSATEAVTNAVKAVEDATMAQLNTTVIEKVKNPIMRPLVIKMITSKPKNPAEAIAAIDAVLKDPMVIEAMKGLTPGTFGGNMQGEAKDGDKTNNNDTDWREAAAKNAAGNAKRLGVAKTT